MGEVYKGEVCVCSPRLVEGGGGKGGKGEKFFELGGKRYYRTGDVAEVWMERGGERGKKMIRLICRMGGMEKMSDGRWVSGGKVEGVLEGSPFVVRAFCMVSPYKPFLVCALNLSDLGKEMREKGRGGGGGGGEEIGEVLGRELRSWCIERGLEGREIPVRYWVDAEEWGVGNGLITETEKKKRGCLGKRFEKIKEELFNSSFSSSSSEITISTSTKQQFHPDFLSLLSQTFPTLSSLPSLLNPSTFFSDLGGDSLSASHFSSLLSTKLHLKISLSDLFSFPLLHLSSRLSSSFGVGEGGREVDWEREFELPPELVEELEEIYKERGERWQEGSSSSSSLPTLDELRSLPKTGNICLVGATGFLAPYLISSILSSSYFSFPSIKLFCLARGKSEEDVKERVLRGVKEAQLFEKTEPFLDRIIFLPLSLSSSSLIIPSPSYSYPSFVQALEGGHIFLNAAWVNMVIPYQGLKKTNVGGVENVVKLVGRSGGRLHFISSVAAGSSFSGEEKWFRLSQGEMEGKEGYGQTKVVGERRVYEVMKRFPFDGRVYRPSYICGAIESGFSNKSDFTAYLLKTCVRCMAAPVEVGRTKKLHWVPVDFVGKGVVSLGLSNDISLCFSLGEGNRDRGRGGRGGVFHFTLEGPYLGRVLGRLWCLYPKMRDATQYEWRNLVKEGEKEGGFLKEFEVNMMMRYEWGDVDGRFSRGVEIEKTREKLSLLGVEYLDGVSDDHLDRFMKFYQKSGFFGE